MTRVAAAGAGPVGRTAAFVVLAGVLGMPAPHASPVSSMRADVPSYADGAPPGFSGGFSEQSCHACHFHAELNAGPGRVTIAGVPERFVAGERYPLTITLSRPDMKLGGFQLTARFKDDGAQAGTLAPGAGEEERIGIDVQGNVQYANQRHKGTTLAEPNTARWTLIWTAPKSAGPVVFHVAANAADGDQTAEGDRIHTALVEAVHPAASPGIVSVERANRRQQVPAQLRSIFQLN